MRHILVVDDDEPLRTMIRELIVRWGHSVVEASNGVEALAAFNRSPAEIVLIDLMMPKKDGLGTIRQLIENYPGVKIIAMSGGLAHGPEAYLELAQQLGAQQVLRKPFSKEELRRALDAV